MYGSSFCIETFRPRLSRIMPIDAEVSPLPSEETTPPVMKMCLAIPRGRESAAGGCSACAEGRDEARVVGGRVDPDRRAFDRSDRDASSVLQKSELLEPLRSLERRGARAREPLERLAAERVEADVLEGRDAREARARDRRAREVERAAAEIDDDLHARRVAGALVGARRGERGDVGARRAQCVDEAVDVVGPNLGLVA